MEAIEVNDYRGTANTTGGVTGAVKEEVKVPEGAPINPAPQTQVFAPTRREVLSRYKEKAGIVINGVLFKVRKVTAKDLILRPVWQLPATPDPTTP